MANLKMPKSEEDFKKLTVAGARKEYLDIASDYIKILDNDIVYCSHCGQWKSSTNFYSNKNNASGLEHYACKSCILDMCTDFDRKTKIRTDNKEKTIETFKRLDWYFDLNAYNAQLQSINEGVNEKNRSTAAQQWIVMRSSLPQYSGLKFADSDLGIDEETLEEEMKISQKTIKAAKKRFGSGYTNEEYIQLISEYNDWISRYECNTKAQEEVFENLSIIKLLKKKAIRDGKPTKDYDSQQQNWLDTGNLKPKQNTMDTLSEAQTLGTLIQKWENEKPIPECDPELADVDKIGLYLDVFFKAHLSKVLGIKNNLSHIYENFMKKYTVNKPEYDEDEDSEELFDRIFGTTSEE